MGSEPDLGSESGELDLGLEQALEWALEGSLVYWRFQGG